MPQVNGILSIVGFVFMVLAATTGLYLWTHIALTRVCFCRNYVHSSNSTRPARPNLMTVFSCCSSSIYWAIDRRAFVCLIVP